MSLLLKALEKSEDEKSKDEQQAGSASAGDGAAGIKLAGGGKLGSALASKQSDAQKVQKAAAVEQPTPSDEGEHHEHDEHSAELVKAARKASLNRIVSAGAVVGFAVAGYFAYLQYGSLLFRQDEGVSAETGSQQAVSTDSEVDTENLDLLPLAEPLYNIQENVLLASIDNDQLREDPGNQDSEIASNISSIVTDILQAQVQKQAELVQDIGLLEEEPKNNVDQEIAQVIGGGFDAETATLVDSSALMLARLEELGKTPYERSGAGATKVNHVSKQGGGEALAQQSAQTDEVGSSSDAATTPAEFVLEKKDNGLRKIMEQGIESFNAGDLNTAEDSFRTIIAAESRNINALIGLAKVHQARGSVKLAVATLLKASEYSPNDPKVISELISLQLNSADPVLSENRIRSLFNRRLEPAIEANLHFILGNLYAKNRRWDVAKSSFYSAHLLDSGNPDIAFNLAVIYDYLNEKRSAVEAYKIALANAKRRTNSFDTSVAEARISQLSGR